MVSCNSFITEYIKYCSNRNEKVHHSSQTLVHNDALHIPNLRDMVWIIPISYLETVDDAQKTQVKEESIYQHHYPYPHLLSISLRG